jgi:thioredoxin-dependent peroxiredoxin
MTTERKGLIKFRGADVMVLGNDIEVGQMAPEFVVQTQDWTEINGLESTKGKIRIIAAIPSLDTDVCDRETRRFNQEASELRNDVVVLVVSTDLPFAQKRWCGASGIENVIVYSDHLYTDFGTKYGCLIKEARLLRRAIFMVDQSGKVFYSEYMPTLGTEPNYGEIMALIKEKL